MMQLTEPEFNHDGRLEQAISMANVPTLLALLVQLTGDMRWLEAKYKPGRNRGLGDNDSGALPETTQTEIRGAALGAIRKWQQDGLVAIPFPSHDLLLQIMSFVMGDRIPPEYAPMMAVELGLKDSVETESVVPPPGFRAIIIGAGVSGLCAAHHLGRRGIPCTIVEKNASVGGTWFENRYPAAGVDTPSHLYGFSFAKHDWTHYFSRATDIHQYLAAVADGLGELCEFRLKTEAVRATYHATDQEWSVEVRCAGGQIEELRANIVISAVGALNRPIVPAIEGLDRFKGPTFHTAAWPPDLDIAGKRVALIGTGASAMQIVPAIAATVESLTIFQRSPQWAAPFEKFQKEIAPQLRYLLREVPLYERWYRLRLSWTFNDRIHLSLQKDPKWPSDRSINAINDGHRDHFTRYISEELGEHQDLMPAVLPTYPPFLKRMLLDNGWFRTLTHDNVHLVWDDAIERVTEDAVITASGEEHKFDVIVLATGFDALHFLASIDVIGRTGRSLAESWDGDDARAYLGIAVPEFPNFFCMYGPNLQPGHGGSLTFILECEMHYIMDLLEQMFRRGIGSVECRKEVFDAYTHRVDEAHERMIWTHPGASTYYRNSRGRVVVNSPFKVVEYWHMTRHANIDDYVTEDTRSLSD